MKKGTEMQFETWRWRRMFKIKRTDRITNVEVFQRAKEERLLFKFFRNRRHLWIGHIVRHNEFVVNIFEGAISGKRQWEDLDYST
jgi:hypothetical protein